MDNSVACVKHVESKRQAEQNSARHNRLGRQGVQGTLPVIFAARHGHLLPPPDTVEADTF